MVNHPSSLELYVHSEVIASETRFSQLHSFTTVANLMDGNVFSISVLVSVVAKFRIQNQKHPIQPSNVTMVLVSDKDVHKDESQSLK